MLPDITITGRLTDEPSLRFTAAGKAVAGFTIAANARYLDKNTGEWKDGDSLFVRCSAWDRLAENIVESAVKGQEVIVTGRLRTGSYEKDGVTHRTTEMTVDEFGVSVRWGVARFERAEKRPAAPAEPRFDDETPPF